MCVIFLYPCDKCFIDMLKVFFFCLIMILKKSVHREKLSIQINIHYVLSNCALNFRRLLIFSVVLVPQMEIMLLVC